MALVSGSFSTAANLDGVGLSRCFMEEGGGGGWGRGGRVYLRIPFVITCFKFDIMTLGYLARVDFLR